jgi:hypothetical protein
MIRLFKKIVAKGLNSSCCSIKINEVVEIAGNQKDTCCDFSVNREESCC